MKTTYGNLSAYNVPYVVVPQSFVTRNRIPGNAISAVICNGNMYYAIMGDTNGDVPQVIGEASMLVAKTCFPDESIAGDNGHARTDVLCITPGCVGNVDLVFMTEFKGVNESYITDFDGLRALGDNKV